MMSHPLSMVYRSLRADLTEDLKNTGEIYKYLVVV